MQALADLTPAQLLPEDSLLLLKGHECSPQTAADTVQQLAARICMTFMSCLLLLHQAADSEAEQAAAQRAAMSVLDLALAATDAAPSDAVAGPAAALRHEDAHQSAARVDSVTKPTLAEELCANVLVMKLLWLMHSVAAQHPDHMAHVGLHVVLEQLSLGLHEHMSKAADAAADPSAPGQAGSDENIHQLTKYLVQPAMLILQSAVQMASANCPQEDKAHVWGNGHLMQSVLIDLLEGPACIASVAHEEFCQQGVQ